MQAVELMVDGIRYGVPLSRVVEVAPRVEIAQLVGVGGPILGYIAYRGQPVPAVDLRLRLGRSARPATLDDHLLIARAARRFAGVAGGSERPVALLVDRVIGLTEIDPTQATPPPRSAAAVAGILALPDGLMLIADLDRVLSLEEERAVDEALARLQERG